MAAGLKGDPSVTGPIYRDCANALVFAENEVYLDRLNAVGIGGARFQLSPGA